jgi:hypothetical protein
MSEDRLSKALKRIEGACARAEAAVSSPARGGQADPARVAQLEARHAQLRQRIEDAISELDQLLGEGASA